MSKNTQLLVKTLSQALLITACSVGFTMATNAAPLVIPAATTAKSGPVFLGESTDYPFSEAVRAGNTLYLSGQIGLKEGRLIKGGIKTETKQTLDNINATLLKYGYQKSDIVKCMAMLTDMDDFDDFNSVYKAEMDKPYPTRSAFGVSELAAGASVEIECMAIK
ncbi:RidA family protein [Psychrobacter sp. JB385]|uniref:RidA family protein n=1 Tax=Psychrobacter sp. JB385 TaxID=1434841 RepID=UPI000B35CD66|nr:RidA family protein [Psychrobacter sp. JB385]